MKTLDDIREYLWIAFKDGHLSKEQILDIMKRFNAAHLSEIPTDKLNDFYADCISLADKQG